MCKKKKKNRKVPVGISLPTDMLKCIDKERGDISRSVYVTELLKQVLQAQSD